MIEPRTSKRALHANVVDRCLDFRDFLVARACNSTFLPSNFKGFWRCDAGLGQDVYIDEWMAEASHEAGITSASA